VEDGHKGGGSQARGTFRGRLQDNVKMELVGSSYEVLWIEFSWLIWVE
jgi:hypothetical protein